MRQARLTGRPVPIPALTTETAESVALPGGDVQATVSVLTGVAIVGCIQLCWLNPAMA